MTKRLDDAIVPFSIAYRQVASACPGEQCCTWRHAAIGGQFCLLLAEALAVCGTPSSADRAHLQPMTSAYIFAHENVYMAQVQRCGLRTGLELCALLLDVICHRRRSSAE